MHIFRDWLQYKVAEYLRERGYCAVVPTGYFNREKLIPRFPFKLAAYEAGLGVYGRCGIIVTSKYGPRVNLGVVLTDTNLEPDEKLTDFNPCLNCRLCVDLCPPKAIREAISPPVGHDRDKCINFVLKLRKRTCDRHFYCGYCYDSCPVGKTDSPGFRLSRYRNLLDLAVEEREHVIKGVIKDIS
jgi:epoxyqueuosine reductase QueG